MVTESCTQNPQKGGGEWKTRCSRPVSKRGTRHQRRAFGIFNVFVAVVYDDINAVIQL
ncbi:hypothetical protein OK016_01280 [Vibrio chagasii]|nr:hypothetical protein [Vibrio chagasii]